MNVQYSEYEETLVDIYLPDTDHYTTVVNFHGGGLDRGDKYSEDFEKMAAGLTAAGYALASVEYRKYPNAKFPDFLLDAAKATAFVKNFVKDYGGNGDVIIAGQSAGAWMSLMLCLNKKYLENEGIDSEEIKGWFIDSAQPTSHFNVLVQETGAHKRTQRIDEYAPLYFLGKDSKFSKMILLTYENDVVCRNEQNQLFYKAVLAFNPEAKIEYRLLGGKHCNAIEQRDENGGSLYAKLFLDWILKE